MLKINRVFLLVLGVLIIASMTLFVFVSKRPDTQNKLISSNFRLPLENKDTYTGSATVSNLQLRVEVVNTPESLSKGLSGRSSMCENCGMLFDFGYKDTQPTFWMKDMNFAIDIIWINDGKVFKIEKDAQPEPGKRDAELIKYSPKGPIDYVLEVNAGFADKNNVLKGDPFEYAKR